MWSQTPAVANSKSSNSKGEAILYLERLAENFNGNGYHFAPLVTTELALFCGLDILFLRPDPPGSLIKSGDIDNRLKTLFDALRMPVGAQETGSDAPTNGEDPFFVLMEDDRLVSKIALETDMLLQPVGDVPNPNDCRLVITVNIRPISTNVHNLDFH